MESSESSPPRSDVRMGTPMTGRSVIRGHHAGKRGRLAGSGDDDFESARFGTQSVLAHRLGVAMGREDVHLVGDAAASSSSAASSMTSASDSEPIRMPTSGRLAISSPFSVGPPRGPVRLARRLPLLGPQGDVGTVLRSVEADGRHALIGPRPGLGEGLDQRAVTVSTRPPAVTTWPSGAAVPAWNTSTPATPAASSRPAITSPFELDAG